MWRLLVSEAVSLWLISMETCSNSGFLRLFLHWKLCSFQWYIICVYTLQGGYFLLFPKNSAVSGRVFIRWLIDFTVGIRKRHHYIQCCRQLKKKDLWVWLTFFYHFNGKKTGSSQTCSSLPSFHCTLMLQSELGLEPSLGTPHSEANGQVGGKNKTLHCWSWCQLC